MNKPIEIYSVNFINKYDKITGKKILKLTILVIPTHIRLEKKPNEFQPKPGGTGNIYTYHAED